MNAVAYDFTDDWIGRTWCYRQRGPDDCYENRVRAEMGMPPVRTEQPRGGVPLMISQATVTVKADIPAITNFAKGVVVSLLREVADKAAGGATADDEACPHANRSDCCHRAGAQSVIDLIHDYVEKLKPTLEIGGSTDDGEG